MNDTSEIPQNVKDFWLKCAKDVGEFEGKGFYNSIEEDIGGVNSPIEQILYCAIKKVQCVNEIFSEHPHEIGDKVVSIGLGIYSQREIGKYRVDFYLRYSHYGMAERDEKARELIVECDSQEWHERTEKEQAYEKTRDRFLQKEGYKVFHYTGKDIMNNAENIALEIILQLTQFDKELMHINGIYHAEAFC